MLSEIQLLVQTGPTFFVNVKDFLTWLLLHNIIVSHSSHTPLIKTERVCLAALHDGFRPSYWKC